MWQCEVRKVMNHLFGSWLQNQAGFGLPWSGGVRHSMVGKLQVIRFACSYKMWHGGAR